MLCWQSLRLRIWQYLYQWSSVVLVLCRVHGLNRKPHVWITTCKVLARSCSVRGIIMVHLWSGSLWYLRLRWVRKVECKTLWRLLTILTKGSRTLRCTWYWLAIRALILKNFVHSLDEVCSLWNCWTRVVLEYFTGWTSHTTWSIVRSARRYWARRPSATNLLMWYCLKLCSLRMRSSCDRLRCLMLIIWTCCLF